MPKLKPRGSRTYETAWWSFATTCKDVARRLSGFGNLTRKAGYTEVCDFNVKVCGRWCSRRLWGAACRRRRTRPPPQLRSPVTMPRGTIPR